MTQKRLADRYPSRRGVLNAGKDCGNAVRLFEHSAIHIATFSHIREGIMPRGKTGWREGLKMGGNLPKKMSLGEFYCGNFVWQIARARESGFCSLARHIFHADGAMFGRGGLTD